jgi:hypothetical protein
MVDELQVTGLYGKPSFHKILGKLKSPPIRKSPLEFSMVLQNIFESTYLVSMEKDAEGLKYSHPILAWHRSWLWSVISNQMVSTDGRLDFI